MKASRIPLGTVAMVMAVLAPSYAGTTGSDTAPARSSIPYVPTRHDAVRDMLWMANVGPEDVVYDLGSGDGRIVIAAVRDFGARRAVGIERSPQRIRQSRAKAAKAGVTDRVEFILGDLFASDFSQASVLTLYLEHRANIDLRSKIFSTMKPGSRVVSHQFSMGEWKPHKTLVIHKDPVGMWGDVWHPFRVNPRVPDYAANERTHERDTISMWMVPAPVAGVWRGTIETSQGSQDIKLTLHQRLSDVTGTFQLAGATNLEGHIRTELRGDHLRYECNPVGMPYGEFQVRFDGHVRENTMQGTLAVSESGQVQERRWQAQRDVVDFSGRWEWPCATASRTVSLQIERADGHLAATYVDGALVLPVTDFYDFGGGFYFTLCISPLSRLVRIRNHTTGWLIGEAIVEEGALQGKIEFHRDRMPDETTTKPAIQEWAPRLVSP